MPRHADGILHSSQVRHSAGVERLAVYDEGVERRFAGLIGRAAEADGGVALVGLACLAACLGGVEGKGGRLGAGCEGEEGGVCGGGEGAGPGVYDEGWWSEDCACLEEEEGEGCGGGGEGYTRHG